MKLIRRSTLRFQEGNSDKLYEVDIVELASNSCLVNFRYGRFAKPLTEGSKTPEAVSQAQAEKVANSLLISKINKGYQVAQGYDPVSKQTIGAALPDKPQPNAAFVKSVNATSRANLIIQRLQQFAQGERYITAHSGGGTIAYIDGYSLTRTLWKAGELRLPGLLEAVRSLLSGKPVKFGKPELLYYSMAWALIRSADPNALALIQKIKDKIPAHLYQVACAELTGQVTTDLNTVAAKADLLQMISALQAYERYAAVALRNLDKKRRDYAMQVLHWQGWTAEIDHALQALRLEDIEGDYLKQHLSPSTYQSIQTHTAAYPELQTAIETVLWSTRDKLVETASMPYKAAFDEYQNVLKQLDLDKLLNGSRYLRDYALKGDWDYWWSGSEKRALQNALKRHFNDVTGLLKKVQCYAQLNRVISSEPISEARLNVAYQVLQQHNLYQTVVRDLAAKVRVSDANYHIMDHINSLPLEVRAKLEGNSEYYIKDLFDYQFKQLRLEADKQVKILLKQYGGQLLNAYLVARFDASKRADTLALIAQAPANKSFNTAFRQLYKTAEMLDDYPVLALLNQRLELTPDSGVNYQTTPFSRQTKLYFKRRMQRHLRQLAKLQPTLYTKLAREILILADDTAGYAQAYPKQSYYYFPSLSALHTILHKHSVLLEQYGQSNWFINTKKLAEAAQPEAYPQLWQAAPDDLFYVLLNCKAEIVNNFAYRHLSTQTAFIQQQPLTIWQQLIHSRYLNTASLAFTALQPHLAEREVLLSVLSSAFVSIRQQALATLQPQAFKADLSLLTALLLADYEDVAQFAQNYLYTAQTQYPQLAADLVSHLLQIPADKQAALIARLKWILTEPLKGQTPLANLIALLAQTSRELQQLGAALLVDSSFSFAELGDCFMQMSISPYAEVRAGAVGLLAKLPDAEKLQYQALIFTALTDSEASLRQQARQVVASMQDQGFQRAALQFVLPSLFKAEPVEGFADDMLALIAALPDTLKAGVDTDTLWRLLMAKSRMAEQAGALILPAHTPDEFSIKQLAILTHTPTLAARQWALNALQTLPARVMAEFLEAVIMLDNRWEDTRQQALQWLSGAFHAEDWTSEHIIAVCDVNYADVQQFGRELLLQAFEQDDAATYLTKLSQHPSLTVQRFVSDFLSLYASDQPNTILALENYFRTVLMQVNKARLVKDRVIAFLFKEAAKRVEIAQMVARLFSDQSLTRVLADKAQYIQSLFALQTRYQITQTPVKVLMPTVRAY
jgi:predicted DNA-binding WGR domain protein